MTIPSKQLYTRKEEISALAKAANAKRTADIEREAEERFNEKHKREERQVGKNSANANTQISDKN